MGRAMGMSWMQGWWKRERVELVTDTAAIDEDRGIWLFPLPEAGDDRE